MNDPDLRTKSTRPVGQVRAENPVRLLPGRIWYRRPHGGCGVGPNPIALDTGEVPRPMWPSVSCRRLMGSPHPPREALVGGRPAGPCHWISTNGRSFSKHLRPDPLTLVQALDRVVRPVCDDPPSQLRSDLRQCLQLGPGSPGSGRPSAPPSPRLLGWHPRRYRTACRPPALPVADDQDRAVLIGAQRRVVG